MTAIPLLAAVATIFAAGIGLLRLILRDPNRLTLPEQFALAWLFGTGFVSLALWLVGFFGSHTFLFGTVIIGCAALPFAAWKTKGPFRFQPLRRLTKTEWLLATVLGLQVMTIVYLCFGHTLGWDGLLNWEIKARYAFANHGVLPAFYFRDAGRAFSHPEYPLAIPFTELWIYLWLGEPSQFWSKIIFPFFYVSGAILLVAIAIRLSAKPWTALAAAIALFFVPQLTVEAGSAIVGYADFPMSVLYLAAIGYLLCSYRENWDDCFRIYAVCLALLPWVKREGIILWLIAAACGGFVILRGKLSPKLLLALLPGLGVAAGWRLYLTQLHAVSSPDFMPLTFQTLIANVHRTGPILASFASEFMDTRPWGLFWFIIALATFYFVRQYRDARAVVLLFAIAAPVAAYASIYIFSDWPDYHRHLGLSIHRLLMHVAQLATLTLPAALGSLRLAPKKLRESAPLETGSSGTELAPAICHQTVS
jgi:hypothetical protein